MTNDGGLCQAQRRFHKSEWEYQSTGEGCECHWLAWIKWLRVLFLGFWQGTSKLVLSIRIDHNHNNLSRALCIRVFVDSNRNVTGASCWCSMTLSDLFCPGAGQRVFELLDLKPDICEAGSTWSTTSTYTLLMTSLVSAGPSTPARSFLSEDIGDPFPEQSKEVLSQNDWYWSLCHTRKLLLQTQKRLHYQIPQVFNNAVWKAQETPAI